MLSTRRDSEMEGACDLGKRTQKSQGVGSGLGGAGGVGRTGGAGEVFRRRNIVFGAEV